MEPNPNLQNTLQLNKWYPLRISMDIGGKLRLTKGKTGWIHKGFAFLEGEALFPTEFELVESHIDNQGILVLKGRIRDNDHHHYLLAIESDSKSRKHSRISHGKKGHWVTLELKESVNYGIEQSLHKGQVKVTGSSVSFTLLPTEDKKCLQQETTDDSVYIFIGHRPSLQ